VPCGPGSEPPDSVPGVLHPVGKLPAAVYWRRRLLLLAGVLAVLGGAAWLVVTVVAGRDGAGSASAATRQRPVPALERVVPPFTAIATPTPPSITAAIPAADAVAAAPAPVAGGPCTDDMIALEVRAPAGAAVGSKPTFELVVSNTSAVPCVRALDKGLQEIQLFDSSGNRVWGSNDCFPEQSSDPRTLAPGEVVSVPIVWGGLTSEPTCTAPRAGPTPGNYLVRARLDTKSSPDVPVALT
jgi:hypothetical protein